MILYLHGFNSSPASHKARETQAWLAERKLAERMICPALPHRPRDAVALIEGHLKGRPSGSVTLFGSSLGGYYATWFAERFEQRAVLINPAIRPHEGLAELLGRQRNLYTNEAWELTQAHVEEWRALWIERVDPERYLLLLETGDEVLDWRDAARKYEGARTIIRDGGDHTLKSYREHLPRAMAFAGI